MRIVAIDPGQTTGVCSWDVSDDGNVSVHAFQVSWGDRHFLHQYLTKYGPDHVVVEDFRLYSFRAQEQINNSFPSVRVIGMVDLTCHLLNVEMHLEPASSIKNVAIPLEHVPFIPKSEHCRDAYKHARFFYMVRLGHVDTKGISNEGRNPNSSQESASSR